MMKSIAASVLIAAAILVPLSPALVTADTAAPEIIVKFDDSVDLTLATGREAVHVLANEERLHVRDTLPDQNIVVVDAGVSADTIERLERDPRVEYAEPNYRRSVSAINTNDTLGSSLWALDNIGQTVNGTVGTANADINAPEAWAVATNTADVIVAIIDTGVLYTHPDLAANMWDGATCVDENGHALGGCMHGYDFANNDKDPLPASSDSEGYHGTHVAGTVAAVPGNGIGIAGVAPHAKIMALRFFRDDGNAYVSDEVRAIDFARENGAKIINASYTGVGFSQAEYDAIKRFEDAGGIFIAAAGNARSNSDISPLFPAAHTLGDVMAVAATDQNDNLAIFSNYGTIVDIAAPGVNIVSTYLPNANGSAQYAIANGTSMAAPHVAGLAALLWGYAPTLSLSQLESIIKTSGDPLASLQNKTETGRRINAFNAVTAARDLLHPPATTPVPPATTTVPVLAPAPAPIAILSNLPSATDTSALPSLAASVGGEGVTHYKYMLDHGSWSDELPIITPITATDLLNGTHTLSVMGSNASSTWQTTASSTVFTWTVQDLTAPTLRGLTDDTAPTKSKTWSWTSDDPNALYHFTIDTASTTGILENRLFAAASSTTVSSGNGTFYLHIQAKDSNGNETASTFSFVMDTLAPIATLGGVASTTDSAVATFIVGGDGVTSYKYRLDAGSWAAETAISTPMTITGLGNGTHAVDVLGADVAGNWQASDAATSFSWTVTLPVPSPVPAPAPAQSGGGSSGGGGGGAIATPAPVAAITKIGDTDNDGAVGVLDFNALMVHWGETGPSGGAADTNRDGIVDILDFNSIMINWS